MGLATLIIAIGAFVVAVFALVSASRNTVCEH